MTTSEMVAAIKKAGYTLDPSNSDGIGLVDTVAILKDGKVLETYKGTFPICIEYFYKKYVSK